MKRGVSVAAAGVAAGIVVIGALGVWHAIAPGSAPATTDLDGEKTLAAYFSGALLLGAAVSAALLARQLLPVACLAVAGLFAVMGLDEMLSWHEYLEWRLGIDWQLLYAGPVAIGGVAWLVLLNRLRSQRLPVGALAAGTVAWGLSQVLENVAWGSGDQPVRWYTPLMVTEEVLEMIGSFLFGVGLVLVLDLLSDTPRERASGGVAADPLVHGDA